MAFADLLIALPPILIANVAITSPSVLVLADARVYGSSNATYGTVGNGYTPRLDGKPFAMLETVGTKEDDTRETNRIWTTYQTHVFLAIVHADTAPASGEFQLIALSFVDSLRQVIAANRRIAPASQTLFPASGDVRWVMRSAKLLDKHHLLGVPYYGMDVLTEITVTNSVEYQG